MLRRSLARPLNKTLFSGVRAFGGASHGPAPKAPNGLQDPMKQDDGHDHDHHHDHVHTAKLNHRFIASGINHKTMVFDGLRASKNQVVGIDHSYAHLNNLPLYQ